MPLKLFRRVAAGFSTSRQYSGQSDTRAYAVGDIHGRLDLLEDLLGQITDDIAQRPVDKAVIVFLGDYIDRGPDSAGVIERLRTLDGYAAKAGFLLGNHEEILLRVLDGEADVAYDWLGFGGDACVESYGVSASSLQAMDEARIAEVLGAAIPATHIAFLRGCGDTFSFGDYLFVHAGIRPGVPIAEQEPHDLRWIRRPFLSDTKDHGRIVVHGHTISESVEERSNRIGIDTGAYKSGILTSVAIEGGERRYLATGG